MIHGIDGEFSIGGESTAANEFGTLFGEGHFAEFDAICLKAIKKRVRGGGKTKRTLGSDKFGTGDGCLGFHGAWFV